MRNRQRRRRHLADIQDCNNIDKNTQQQQQQQQKHVQSNQEDITRIPYNDDHDLIILANAPNSDVDAGRLILKHCGLSVIQSCGSMNALRAYFDENFIGFLALTCPVNKNYSLVEFESYDDAIKCRRVVNGVPCAVLGGRKLRADVVQLVPKLRDIEGKLQDDKNGNIGGHSVGKGIGPQFLDNIGEYIPGLSLVENFITEEEERLLIDLLLDGELSPHWTTVKDRKVMHFGHDYLYRTFSTQQSVADIPAPIQHLVMERALAHGHIPYELNQLTVQYYPSGSGIPSHVDRHSVFGECILALTLQSQVVMDFEFKESVDESSKSEQEGKNWRTTRSYAVPLARRSLLVMTGEARYRWHHRIRERTTDIMPDGQTVIRGDRISLTMRRIPGQTTDNGDCPCGGQLPFCD